MNNPISKPKDEATKKTTLSFPVIFAIFQTGNRANGGVESITQIIEHTTYIRPIVVTQIETSIQHRWRKAGAEVHVWPLPYRIGTSFYQSNIVDKLRRIMAWIWYNFRTRQLIKKTGSQIIHCNDGLALWHTAFGARIAGAGVIQNVRDVKAPHQKYGWHWHIMFRLSQRIVVLSKEMRAVLFKHFPVLARDQTKGQTAVDYIYSIVDFEQMKPVGSVEQHRLRHELGVPSNSFAIGYVATFNSKKAQLSFIKQAGPLLKNIPNIQLYFLGDFNPTVNDYANACLEAVQRLGLQDIIHFEGYTTRVANWYQALDLTVLASQNEGLARCMIESIACGTPMVSFDVCSAREILEEHNAGLVVPQGDYNVLVERIMNLVEDSSLRQRSGKNGARAARVLFDSRVIARQYETLYRQLATQNDEQNRF